MIYVKMILSFVILLLATNLTVIFSVAFGVGDAFPVQDQDAPVLSDFWSFAGADPFHFSRQESANRTIDRIAFAQCVERGVRDRPGIHGGHILVFERCPAGK